MLLRFIFVAQKLSSRFVSLPALLSASDRLQLFHFDVTDDVSTLGNEVPGAPGLDDANLRSRSEIGDVDGGAAAELADRGGPRQDVGRGCQDDGPGVGDGRYQRLG